MTTITLSAARRLRGTIAVPGDKSISHRAIIFNAIAEGNARISHFLTGADCLSTIRCVEALGVRVERTGDEVRIFGRGLRGLRAPAGVLDCGNSGTTIRLLTGLLAGQAFSTTLTGDASLQRRPMRRVIKPLRQLGAVVEGTGDGYAPLMIYGQPLHGGSYDLPVASAQVKSALLLAGLLGDAPLILTGQLASRDHTERLFTAMGLDIKVAADRITLFPPSHPVFPYPVSLRVPGDPSSAAFWWVAAAIHPDAEITTTGVCLNPTRTGALDVLRAMGAQIAITNRGQAGEEPTGDVTVRGAGLRGLRIDGPLIPRLIDELPVLAVAAAHAVGETVIADAAELRVKESDRIATVVRELRAMGAPIDPTVDGLIIGGGGELHGAPVHSHGDHRLAMALAVAALTAEGTTVINDAGAADVSYPAFWEDVQSLIGT
ncbi:MAG: 3-phosphoshikimate 1-carboxyvinyltransferase [Herpetosiphonaceae bacterium]|nr:3-phosphoshikimate 1-carboxyvinyltransferase [Herpetosiphonaceae bacterium]